MRDPTGDFAADTTVEAHDGRYRASLERSWELWGPAGGYVSAIALRAAGLHSRLARPASYACHYLGVAGFGPIDVDVVTRRSAKRAESLGVTLSQNGAPFLEAMVWTVDDDMAGLHHDHARMPDVPRPEKLRPWQDMDWSEDHPYASFWSNLEERVCDWQGSWQDRVPGAPARRGWCRLRPTATFSDPFLDAARSVLLIDTMGWPAAMMAYADGERDYIAPTIELAVRFHRPARDQEWLLCVTESPVAAEGLMGSTAEVWDGAGRLVASGGQQMLFRPAPGRRD